MPQWHHSPIHQLTEKGAYIVTAGTYQKESLLNTPQKLNYVRDSLLSLSQEYGWNLQSWSVLSNHYHFVAVSLDHSQSLSRMIQQFHSITAREINAIDRTSGRKVWFQYWDTRLTYEKSYLARLNYVHNNPVHHGLVSKAVEYEWCSAQWFETYATASFFRTVNSFRFDKVNIEDDF